MAKKKKQKREAPPPPPVRRPPRAAQAPAGPTRREQERAARAAADRQAALRRKLTSAGLAVAALAAVGGYVVYDRRQDAAVREALTASGCTVDTKADPTRPTGQNHVQSASFSTNPPSAGDHLGSAASADVYVGNAVPEDGLLVHSLEHGYVIAWHRPDLPADQKAKLTAFQEAHGEDVILAERSSLPVPVAVTAWQQRLLCPQVDTPALEKFFDEHVGNGPEDVPRG